MKKIVYIEPSDIAINATFLDLRYIEVKAAAIYKRINPLACQLEKDYVFSQAAQR